MCVCGACGGVFCLHTRRVQDIRKCLQAKSNNNRLIGKELCKATWRLRKSVLIRPILAIRVNLVVLAVGVALAIVGARMKMTLPILKFLQFSDFNRSCERNCSSIGLCGNLPLGRI